MTSYKWDFLLVGDHQYHEHKYIVKYLSQDHQGPHGQLQPFL